MKTRTIKQTIAIVLAALASASLIGCGGTDPEADGFIYASGAKADGLYEFYYTYENINYNAEYLRYRFYIEGGVPYFYFEKRERPNDYGPATEEDITAKGTVKLSEEQWKIFAEFIEEGKDSPRKDSAESGSRGPWTYIYWQKNPDKQREFSFASRDRLSEFEKFCAEMAGEAE